MGLRDRPGLPGEARLGRRASCAEKVEPLDLVLGDPYDKSDQQALGHRAAAAAARCRTAGPVGLPPRPRARRPGLRPGQAGPAQRDPRPLALGAVGVRLPGAGLRQRRDPRPLRHRRSRRRKYLQPLLDGEISSCYSMTEPQAGADPTLFTTRGRSRTATSGSSTARSGSRRNARYASFFIVMAVTDPDVSAYQGMSMFIVPADTPGRRDHPQRRRRRRAGGPRHATATCATPTCASRPTTCSAARARPSSSPRPASAAAASTTPCARSRQVRKAFDMMCERALSRQTRDGPLASQQRRAGADRRLLDRDRAVPPAGAAHRLADRQAPGLQEGPQGHRRREGGDAEGVPRRRPAGAAPARRARRLQRDAVRRHGDRRRGAWASPTARPRSTRSPSPGRC